MSVELKIKAKSLADEARVIRAEEKKAKAKRKTETVNSLHHHRLQVVRPAARATHIARGYLAGTPYRLIEGNAKSEPPLFAAAQMLAKYGPFKDRAEAQKALTLWVEAKAAKAA